MTDDIHISICSSVASLRWASVNTGTHESAFILLFKFIYIFILNTFVILSNYHIIIILHEILCIAIVIDHMLLTLLGGIGDGTAVLTTAVHSNSYYDRIT